MFIDCDVNGNLRRLSETATDDELVEIWGRICEEYSQITGGNKFSYVFGVTKKVYLLKSKLISAKCCFELSQDEALVNLKKLGYKGNIEKIVAIIKRETIELEGAEKELKNLTKEQKKSTEGDYISWIVSVSKHMGYHIDRKTITVYEFLEMSKQMEKEYKHNKK